MTRNLFMFVPTIVFIAILLSYHFSEPDPLILCKRHIKDTQRYLDTKTYHTIFLYSEACLIVPLPSPYRLEDLAVEMKGETMRRAVSSFSTFFQPTVEERLSCNMTSFEGSEKKTTSMRMLFMDGLGTFKGVTSPSTYRHNTFAVKCPDSIQVIRFTKK